MNRSFDRGRKLARLLLILSMLVVLTVTILAVASLF